jgi:ADP-ribose pyrophosphatase YjhB (NUDIX family)
MAQSYKVFFKDRAIILTDQIDNILSCEFNAILKYANQNELKQFIDNFEQKQYLKTAFIYYHDTGKLLDNFCRHFQYIEAAGGVVIHDDEFLAIERLGVYDLPKGKAEKGEDPLTTAVREIEEECNITSLKMQHQLAPTFHTYHEDGIAKLKKTHWFSFTIDKKQMPTPQTSENITSAFWMKMADIDKFTANSYASIGEVMRSLKTR